MNKKNENIALINPAILRWAREQKGLTPSEVADHLGLTEAGYLAVENGERQLTLDELRETASFLERQVAFFYLSAPPFQIRYRVLMGAVIEVEKIEDFRLDAPQLKQFFGKIAEESGWQIIEESFFEIEEVEKKLNGLKGK